MAFLSLGISILAISMAFGLIRAIRDVSERIDNLWEDYLDGEIDYMLDTDDPDVPWWATGDDQ